MTIITKLDTISEYFNNYPHHKAIAKQQFLYPSTNFEVKDAQSQDEAYTSRLIKQLEADGYQIFAPGEKLPNPEDEMSYNEVERRRKAQEIAIYMLTSRGREEE